jgi:hypothetical protein
VGWSPPVTTVACASSSCRSRALSAAPATGAACTIGNSGRPSYTCARPGTLCISAHRCGGYHSAHRHDDGIAVAHVHHQARIGASRHQCHQRCWHKRARLDLHTHTHTQADAHAHVHTQAQAFIHIDRATNVMSMRALLVWEVETRAHALASLPTGSGRVRAWRAAVPAHGRPGPRVCPWGP